MEFGAILLIVFLIAYMALLSKKQQKSNAEAQTMLNSLKLGDKVKTHIGVYGVIVGFYSTTDGKIATINIGKEEPVLIDLNMRFIAGIDTKKVIEYDENGNEVSLDGVPIEIALNLNNEQVEQKEEAKQEIKEESKQEVIAEEKKVEKEEIKEEKPTQQEEIIEEKVEEVKSEEIKKENE